ncbi:MAG: T9SS type A sorting domain-containing protein, partial [Cyclobacteriaceae bacterium]
ANVNVRIRTADSSALRVRMFDLLGRMVYSVLVRDYDNSAFTLALPSALPEGTYLIQVEQGAGRAVTRVMIGQ